MDPALQELLNKDLDPNTEVEAIIRLDSPAARVPGVRIISSFAGMIATCRLKKNNIRTVYEDENIISMKAARLIAPEPDIDEEESLPNVSIDTDLRRPESVSATGKGVIVAVIDWGCDFAANVFRNNDGTTRLMALWDQRHNSCNNVYGYGKIYLEDEINAALLQPDPYTALDYHPASADRRGGGAHGTHVLDIAAGNGSEGGPEALASESRLIFVHLADKGTGGRANLGDSVRILEALDFIRNKCGDTPWVVNVSIGRHGGPHDGTTLCEQAFDALLSEAPNRYIVQSAGNYFDKNTHACGRIVLGEDFKLPFRIDDDDTTPNEIEIWYPGSDIFTVRVKSPTFGLSAEIALGSNGDILEDGVLVGRLYHRAKDPNNFDNHIDIFLYDNAPAGRWELILKGIVVTDGTFHAWIERDDVSVNSQARFLNGIADPSSTTGSLANNSLPLIVGAYNSHLANKAITNFSSAGPTRDNRVKPDIVAPGSHVLAARSTPRDKIRSAINARIRKSGTSMAAPHVTSLVAVCMQVAGTPLTAGKIRSLVCDHCDPIAPSDEILRYGRGYINVEKTVQAASRLHSVKNNTQFPHEKTMDTDIHQSNGNENTTDKRTNLILLSGGPGLFHPPDTQHDRSWSNYVEGPLELSKTAELQKRFQDQDEDVIWFIYKPAFEMRWKHDITRMDLEGKIAVSNIRKNSRDYVEHLEKCAKARHWKLIWMNHADEFWSNLKMLRDPISRVIYWGHGSTDLWLRLQRESGAIKTPHEYEIVKVDSITANTRPLSGKFLPRKSHVFYGCNTDTFAKTWAKSFGVYATGFSGQISFETIDSGYPKYAPHQKKEFGPTGHPATEDLEVEQKFNGDKTVQQLLSTIEDLIIDAPGNIVSSDLLRILEKGKHINVHELFRKIRTGASHMLTELKPLALPGESVKPAAGDVLLRISPGEPQFAHVAMLADECYPASWEVDHGIMRECDLPGYYAIVVDGGTFPHIRENKFARRILDVSGKLPENQLLLRIQERTNPLIDDDFYFDFPFKTPFPLTEKDCSPEVRKKAWETFDLSVKVANTIIRPGATSDLPYWFARLYQYTTEQELKLVSRLQYPGFWLHFIPYFYELYKKAVDAFNANQPIPTPWSDHFAMAKLHIDPSQKIPYLNAVTTCLVAGARAHIVYDLPVALSQTFKTCQLLYARVPDFDALATDFLVTNKPVFEKVRLMVINEVVNRGSGIMMTGRSVNPSLAAKASEILKIGLDLNTINTWRKNAWEEARKLLKK